MSFDQEAANALIQELGEAIVNAPDYEPYDLTGITLVIESGGTSMFGYAYTTDGEWHAETADFNVLDIAQKLRDAMKIEGQAAWIKCLVQINIETGGINIDFDYDGDQWVVDMADVASFAMSLKPT